MGFNIGFSLGGGTFLSIPYLADMEYLVREIPESSSICDFAFNYIGGNHSHDHLGYFRFK